MLQPAARPQRIELHLAGTLEVIEAVIGLGDGLTDDKDAVIGHEQHLVLWPEDASEPFPLSRFHSEPGIFIVIADTVEKGDFGLADRLDARLFEAGQRGGEGHVGCSTQAALGISRWIGAWMQKAERSISPETLTRRPS